MSVPWLLVGMAAGLYALRLTGFTLARVAVPREAERALAFVPVAMLAALVVASLDLRADAGSARLAAALVAGVVTWRTGRLWVCILVGMSVYWLLLRV